MDFIERWLHISPDGGDGSLEILYIAVLILPVVTLLIKFRRHLVSLVLWHLEQLGKRGSGDRFDN